MLARIQTLYLFLVILCVGLNLQILPFWTYEFHGAEGATALQTLELSGFGGANLSGTISGLFWGFNILLVVTAIIALVTIFLFANRKLQRTLITSGLLSSITALALGIAAAMMLQETITGSGIKQTPGLGFYFLVLTPILFWFASQGVKKDEEIATAYKRL